VQLRGQHRRPDDAVDQRPLGLNPAPGGESTGGCGCDTRRQSLVFFHQPNYDTLIECLPGCATPGTPPRHAPITSGDHLRSKFVKQTTFGGTQTGVRVA